MAGFDLAQQRLCVRVVYDGPAGAGKTTNVEQLAELFAPRAGAPRRERHDPSRLFGRTLSFDWEQINAGLAAGLLLQCQVVSVPGQVGLAPRRRALLEGADVVVYVCDAALSAVPVARAGLVLLDAVALARERPLPTVLQVNKQDGPGAIAPEEMARLIGWQGAVTTGAAAITGKGVMDTFIAAVRAVGQSLQRDIEAGPGRLLIHPAEDARSLARAVEAVPLDPEDAAEMLLEELMDFADAQGDVSLGAVASPRAIAAAPLPPAEPPAGHVWPPDVGRTLLRSLAAHLRAIDVHANPRSPEEQKHTLAGWEITTSVRDRYPDEQSARLALSSAARGRERRDDLALAISLADDGGAWLWTLRRAEGAHEGAAEGEQVA